MKKKAQQTKKKGVPQQKGKKQATRGAPNQNRGRRAAGKQNVQPGQQGRGTQGRRKGFAGKQNQLVQQGHGPQNNRKKQNVGNANRGKLGGARVTANRLKSKQGSVQKVKRKKNNVDYILSSHVFPSTRKYSFCVCSPNSWNQCWLSLHVFNKSMAVFFGLYSYRS